MAPRSIEDIKARADEFADAFENYDPKPGDQDAPIPPVMAVRLAAWRRDAAERELADAVHAAREQQLSWREIGEATGTSGDANNINFRTPQPRKQPYEQMRYVAEDVAAKVNVALQKLTWQKEAPLAAKYRELDVKWRAIPDELIAWAKETEAKAPRIQGGRATGR